MRFLWHNIKQRIIYSARAIGRHGVHSPLVYQLIDQDLKVELPQVLDHIEEHRRDLLSSNLTWTPLDLGAGSRKQARNLGEAVKRATSHKDKGAFLFRWVNRFQPKSILELGTHVGISSAYLLSGCSSSQLTTIEGDPFLHQNAKDFLTRFGNRVDVVLGNFDDVLQQILPTKKWDLVVIDGNHKGEALLRYFNQILPHLSSDAWVLMDDIHWSPDMTNAWEEIVKKSPNKLTLDFFQWGAYLHTERNQKEHFTLRY